MGVVASNPIASADPPAVERKEIEILGPDQIKAVLQGLKGRPLYSVAVLGLATGKRRCELAALRWKDIDFDGGKLRVEQSLEQTNAGLRFKAPKTKAGRRSVTIPPSIVSELRTHWRRQQEQHLALGLGKASDYGLVFARHDGTPWPPDSLTADWPRTLRMLKLPIVTLHALRHTHVS